jgi:hypothetical protein
MSSVLNYPRLDVFVYVFLLSFAAVESGGRLQT